MSKVITTLAKIDKQNPSLIRKKQIVSLIKSKESKGQKQININQDQEEDQEENEDLSLSVASFNSRQSGSKIVGKNIKKGFKKIHWTITPIFNQVTQKEMLYVTGEILLDFDKKYSYLSKRSAWNDVKRVSNIEADYKNEVIIVNFDQQNMNFIEFQKQLPRYLRYPEQHIHQFGNTLVEYEKIYCKYQSFVKLKINEIKNSKESMQLFQDRKALFDKLTREYYKKLNDEQKYFFTVESYPSLVNNQYIAQRMSFNRELCNLLGTDQQSFLHITQRNGIIEFYEFETMLAINKRVIDSIVSHFKDKPVNFENFTNFQDVKEEGYYKFFTYDEIEFFARIRIEYITLDSLLNSPQSEYKYDFYSTLVHIEPSQNTINQINALRQAQKVISQSLIKELESDMTYTIQSEYFVNQLEKSVIVETQKPKKSSVKICGTKEIESNSSSPLEQ
ncbi:hypothetical protein ABPG72_010761 [Tetrahymena utriculariae]